MDSSWISSDFGRSFVWKIFGWTFDGDGGVDSLNVCLRIDFEKVERPDGGLRGSGHHSGNSSHLHHGEFYFVAGENNAKFSSSNV